MVPNGFAEVEHVDMVSSGGSDSSAQVLRNSRPEFRSPAASTYGFITELLYFDVAQSYILKISHVVCFVDASRYQQPVTSKPGRRCGHGRHSRPWLCEWEGGRSPPGMSEANLPWPHLRSGAVEITPSGRVETTPWTSMPPPFIENGTTKNHPRL